VNDATALVIYRFAVAAVAAGTFSLIEAGGSFVVVLIGGVAVGVVVGYVGDWLLAHIRDTPIAVTITLLAPFAAYLPAETLGVSGVLATVVAGLFARRALRRSSSDVRVVGTAAWQIELFLLNGLVFMLIGLQLPSVLRGLSVDLELAKVTAAVALTVVVARLVWVWPSAYLPRMIPAVRRGDPYPPWQTVVVVGWSGLRGVVSLAAALALPFNFPERDLILFLVFAVILVTLVGQGLTLPLVIRALGLGGDADEGHEESHARQELIEEALRRIGELETKWPDHKPLIDQLRTSYQHRAEHEEQLHEAPGNEAEQELVEHRQIRSDVIGAQRDALLAMRDRGAIDDDVLRNIERELDLEEIRMEA
jgi:CPA1 family monovalent cation:H+ antiporter